MRSGHAPLRGEAGRVAERVRAVVGAHRDDAVPEHDRSDDRGDDRDDVDGFDGLGAGRDGLPRGGLRGRWSERLPLRVDPGRHAAVAIAVVVLVVAVATGLWVWSARPRSMPVPAAASVPGASPLVPSRDAASGSPRPTGPAPTAASVAAASSAAEVVVDVAGKVQRPGLYRLPPGSRVDDALTAAGGPLRGVDLTSLNLAAVLVDGQQIAVGRPGAVPPAGGNPTAGGVAPSSAGGLVNLNTATLEQLEALPGIGPALGQRILDYRSEHGSFASVEQLDDVSGIGTVTFARLKPLVTV